MDPVDTPETSRPAGGGGPSSPEPTHAPRYWVALVVIVALFIVALALLAHLS